MSWDEVKYFFEGCPEDLIEVYYFGMEESSWKKLFTWLQEKTIYLESQHGKESPEDLNLNKYLTGELSYIASTKCSNGMVLSLSIIDEDLLLIDIEKKEIPSADEYNLLIVAVNEIADVIKCKDYIMCPEFRKDDAFIVNGKVKSKNT